MPWSIVARRPAAKIATSTTSATPIISAEAVTAVRWGWRRRVLAGEHAREALEAGQRAADQPAQRAHERRRQQREAEDHQQRAEAEHGRGRAGGARVAEQAVEQQRDADRLDDDGDHDPAPAHAPGAGQDAVAHRRHRLDPRRAAGGHEARDDRGDDADDQADDHGARLEHGARGARGRSRTRPAAPPGRARAARPAGDAQQRREQADHERLGEHGAQHLRRARRRACAAARTPSSAGRP